MNASQARTIAKEAGKNKSTTEYHHVKELIETAANRGCFCLGHRMNYGINVERLREEGYTVRQLSVGSPPVIMPSNKYEISWS